MKRLVMVRRASQTASLVLFMYILWSTTYPLTGYFSPSIYFVADPLLVFITSLSQRILINGAEAACAMLVLAAIFGRFFCGWICPLGAILDAVHSLKRPRIIGDRLNSILRCVKYITLTAITVFAFFGIQAAWVLDPVVIMGRFVSLNLIPAVVWVFQAVFIFLQRDLGLRGCVTDAYYLLKPNILGVKAAFFSHSPLLLGTFILVLLSVFILIRIWCRAVCPLGAVYAAVSHIAPFRRIVEDCARCGVCKGRCRMGAIKKDMSYVKSECILCMDCVYDCPHHRVHFGFIKKRAKIISAPIEGKGISRKQFLAFIFSSAALYGFTRKGSKTDAVLPDKRADIIRPPAALREENFIDRCIRCGNCMKVCATNGLQPLLLQGGIDALWTPQLVPEIGYCEYHCTLCGHACPTGAIPALPVEEKTKVRLGLARIDTSLCIPWKKKTQCIVCQEHCPVPKKAIKLIKERVGGTTILKPIIDEGLCIGCGICQNKCPVRPERAVKVTGLYADRL